MSAQLDVLAVLDRAFSLASRTTVPDSGLLYRDLPAARAAVAELIEADKEYDAAIEAAKELNRKIAESGWFEVEFDALRKSGDRVVAAQIRRERALDNVGGAA